MKTKQRLSFGSLFKYLLIGAVLLIGSSQSISAQAQWSIENGTNNIYYNAGNVGIGTSTPSIVSGLDLSTYKVLHLFSSGTTGSRLAVTGGSSASLDMIHSGATANQRWLNIASNAGKTYIRAVSDGGAVTYHFFVGDMSNGNVGIGTSSPAANLDVSAAGNTLVNVTSTGANNIAQIQLLARTGSANKSWYVSNRGGYDAPNNRLSFYDTGVVERFTLADGGNVGIGKSTPEYKLDVNGQINATGFLINGTPISGGGSSQWSGASTGNIFYSGGNVGVGTTDPRASLEVNGRVWVTSDNNTLTNSGVGTALQYFSTLGREA